MFQVWGVHPESDSEWLVDMFESEEEAEMCINLLPEDAMGDGYVSYVIRRI